MQSIAGSPASSAFDSTAGAQFSPTRETPWEELELLTATNLNRPHFVLETVRERD